MKLWYRWMNLTGHWSDLFIKTISSSHLPFCIISICLKTKPIFYKISSFAWCLYHYDYNQEVSTYLKHVYHYHEAVCSTSSSFNPWIINVGVLTERINSTLHWGINCCVGNISFKDPACEAKNRLGNEGWDPQQEGTCCYIFLIAYLWNYQKKREKWWKDAKFAIFKKKRGK